MNEIIQKRIEEAAEEIGLSVYNATSENEEWITDACIEAAKESAFEIINNLWISVDEALPEVDGHGYSKPVLVMNDVNELLVATYSKIYDKWNVVGPVSYHRLVVTHWIPIPSLKGGE